MQRTSDLAVLALCEDETVPAAVAGRLGPEDFRGRGMETLLLYPQDAAAPRRMLLLGLGKAAKTTPETLRTAAATAVQQARALRAPSFTFGFAAQQPVGPAAAAQALAEGFVLGGYRYDRFRTGLSDEQKFSVAAGAFLATFTGDVPFAHLDIAGTAYAERPAKPYHAPGDLGAWLRL